MTYDIEIEALHITYSQPEPAADIQGDALEHWNLMNIRETEKRADDIWGIGRPELVLGDDARVIDGCLPTFCYQFSLRSDEVVLTIPKELDESGIQDDFESWYEFDDDDEDEDDYDSECFSSKEEFNFEKHFATPKRPKKPVGSVLFVTIFCDDSYLKMSMFKILHKHFDTSLWADYAENVFF